MAVKKKTEKTEEKMTFEEAYEKLEQAANAIMCLLSRRLSATVREESIMICAAGYLKMLNSSYRYMIRKLIP